MRASVAKGGVVLFADVRVSLTEGPGADDAWGGHVVLPPGAGLLEGEYVLRAEDGPSGPVTVLGVRGCAARLRGLEPPA